MCVCVCVCARACVCVRVFYIPKLKHIPVNGRNFSELTKITVPPHTCI